MTVFTSPISGRPRFTRRKLTCSSTTFEMATSGEAPTPSAANPNTDSLPNIIASYLKKKGYKRSVEALALDLGTSVDKIAVTMDLVNAGTVLQAISTYNNAEKFPGSFEESFADLCTWIDRSLDQCKVCKGRKWTLNDL